MNPVNTCPWCGIVTMRCSTNYKHILLQDQLVSDGLHSRRMSIEQCVCGGCNRSHFYIDLRYGFNNAVFNYSYPSKSSMPIPDYVPLAIRNDYEEAIKICELSPKAAATLARRALQGMIRDFWEVRGKTLAKEIESLEDKVATSELKVLTAIRRIGNIGAHMEEDVNIIIDVDPNEAQLLLQLVEDFIKSWYVARHDREERCKSILEIAAKKQEEKQNGKITE